MTEITRVPQQPITKGAIGKLWFAVAAIALTATGVAWAGMPAVVKVDTITAGSGPSPTVTDVALINYVGTLPDGKEFDRGDQAVFPLEGVVPGFTKALLQMQRGGKYKVQIPASLAYGDRQVGPIPPNTDLTFDIELIDFRSRAEIEQQQRMMQQMQQQGMPIPGGAPGGVPGSPPGAAVRPEAIVPGAVPPPPQP